ncbi:MAG TPA: MerR family transcriptional regulator [Saprospiraceae bacterium]|nr:MerR family transcriptional regulator [Saprospiraceae bacterium]
MKIPENTGKLYYSISEVAEMFDVTTSLIRYWEGEFPSLKPKKNRSGDRQFTKKDIDNIAQIYALVKEKGYTLDGARRALKSENKNSTAHYVPNLFTKQEVVEKLEKLRIQMKNLSHNLEEE